MDLPEQLLLGVLGAFIQSRSLLITPSNNMKSYSVALHVKRAVTALFDSPGTEIIKCSSTTSWEQLDADIDNARRLGPCVILTRSSRLSPSLQASLAEKLRRSHTILFLVDEKNRLERPLRNALWYWLTLDLNPDSTLLEATQPSSELMQKLPEFKTKIDAIFISPDVSRYMQDIIVFVRTHRFVKKGVSPLVIRDLETLVKTVSLFRNMSSATPSVVGLAAKLLLPLKIELCDPGDDIGLEYGGDLDIVTAYMNNWDTTVLVDTVLDSLPAPV